MEGAPKQEAPNKKLAAAKSMEKKRSVPAEFAGDVGYIAANFLIFPFFLFTRDKKGK